MGVNWNSRGLGSCEAVQFPVVAHNKGQRVGVGHPKMMTEPYVQTAEMGLLVSKGWPGT